MDKRRRDDKRRSGKNPPKAYFGITDHKQVGKTLIPPFSQIPGLELVSWLNNRLPELLWAALIRESLTRERALQAFRRALHYIHDSQPGTFTGKVTHTGLSKLDPAALAGLLRVVADGEDERRALLPLMLLDELPARDHWAKALGNPRTRSDWAPLMAAVAATFDHNTMAATDCRWLCTMAEIAAGKMLLPGKIVDGNVVSENPELSDGLLQYPDGGDISALVRAMELNSYGLDGLATDWPPRFWSECMKKTSCFVLSSTFGTSAVGAATTPARVGEVRDAVVCHAHSTRTTTGVDARHDTVFGIAIYCLDLLRELMLGANAQSILGRAGLRTILECYLTLAYLKKKDSPDLWMSYRVFGAGQAKLAFLKLDESDIKLPYVNLDTLKLLANEDMWQEFLPINVGHWDNASLRQLSIAAGVKDTYDRFYSWTSCFVHGHWAALRECGFVVCGNPLHRFHRVVHTEPQVLPDVIPDSCGLVDSILKLVSECYPVLEARTGAQDER